MNKRSLGKEKEELAAKFLMRQGMKIIEKNFSCKMGEVDLIGLDGEYLVFVEVKYRSKEICGYPQESVSKYKRRKICFVSNYYKMLKRYTENVPVRYDVVSILGNKIRWDKNAFYYDDL